MLNSELAVKLANVPDGFVRDFDAHVYYNRQTRSRAVRLNRQALKDLRDLPILVGELVDRCVGPHPCPMFEICFPRRSLSRMLLWLMEHRAGLTVLVHPVTGDDPRDHSEAAGALWLGTPLRLDTSKLDPSPQVLTSAVRR
jgi:aromatic ring-cleaving dioxygenase